MVVRMRIFVPMCDIAIVARQNGTIQDFNHAVREA